MVDKKLDDWVLPLNVSLNPKIPLENVEELVKRGVQIEHNTDGTAKITGKIIVKGNKNEDFDPR